MNCSDVGPRVTSQDVGRYFSIRAARESGRPRATPLTSAQLELLETSFNLEPYPYVGCTIILTYQTGLQPQQVKRWFNNQRKKYRNNDLALWTSSRTEQDPAAAAKMWRAYKMNPSEYSKALWLGIIATNTGQFTGKVVSAARGEEWERRWGAGRDAHEDDEVDTDEG